MTQSMANNIPNVHDFTKWGRDTMGGKRAHQFETELSDRTDSNPEPVGAFAAQPKKTRNFSPLSEEDTSTTGGKRHSIQTLYHLNTLRGQLEDTNIQITGTGKQDSTVKEKKITIGTLLDFITSVKLCNEEMWVDTLQQRLTYLCNKGLKELTVPFKKQIIAPRPAIDNSTQGFSQTSQQH